MGSRSGSVVVIRRLYDLEELLLSYIVPCSYITERIVI